MRKQGPESYVACHFSCDKRPMILSYFSDMGAISSVETREARYREIRSLTHGQITSRQQGWYLNADSYDSRAGGLSRRASFCLFKVNHLPQNPSAHRRSTGTGVQVTCALSFIHSFVHSRNATHRPQQAVVFLPWLSTVTRLLTLKTRARWRARPRVPVGTMSRCLERGLAKPGPTIKRVPHPLPEEDGGTSRPHCWT